MADRIFILTGGIGSGKSLVAQAFADLGITVVDSDVISHQLTTAGGEAMPAIEQALGPQAVNPDGSLNRPWVRQQVFQDAGKRAALESTLHPLIQKSAKAALGGAPSAYAVYAVPLWVEKYSPRLPRDGVAPVSRQASEIHPEGIIVVDCPESMQIERVMARSRLTADEVQAIMAAQASREDRLAVADHVIVNDQSIGAAVSQVKLLHEKLIAS
jgi:dephospho-CoA kinase